MAEFVPFNFKVHLYNESNNEMLFVADVVSTPDAPVAAFSYTPAQPVTGSAIIRT